MGLSSNSIIHFTRNKTALMGILNETFRVKYCHETIHYKEGKYEFLVPIVSFSDIPFSQINNYGCYGIGLSKKWAESKGLNPVLYLERQSPLTRNILINTPGAVWRTSKLKAINEMKEADRHSFDFIRYLKNYQGDLKRTNKKIVKNYRFSDEREWRYSINPSKPYIVFGNVEGWSANKVKKGKMELNKSIENERLHFTPNDINYIIVKNEIERDYIIDIIEKTKEKFSYAEVKRLSSRIISTQQLKTDF